jgi:hypothetical protein
VARKKMGTMGMGNGGARLKYEGEECRDAICEPYRVSPTEKERRA